MRISWAPALSLAFAGLVSDPSLATDSVACRTAQGGPADPAEIAAALARLRPLLDEAQQQALEHPFAYDNAIRWSNLPLGVVPRTGLRLGDLDANQSAAARRVFEAALSACGLTLLDEIRLADDWLTAYDKRPIGWSGGNYFLSVLGTPGTKTPWMLQIGGHHLAYNFTFNGHQPGATPLFFGTEPIRFEIKGASYMPLDAQSTAMSRLAGVIATLPQARLSGTFTDVVKGVVVNGVPGQLPTGGIDSGFPQSYPGGDQDRGVKVGALSAEQRRRVIEAIESFASFPGKSLSAPLLSAYLDPKALSETFVGFSGSPELSAKGSYVRIDGPRVWMELVVQPAIAHPEDLHYHALWRDKLSDYGGEIRK
jgi:uncharacterized protein DUF3500